MCFGSGLPNKKPDCYRTLLCGSNRWERFRKTFSLKLGGHRRQNDQLQALYVKKQWFNIIWPRPVLEGHLKRMLKTARLFLASTGFLGLLSVFILPIPAVQAGDIAQRTLSIVQIADASSETPAASFVSDLAKRVLAVAENSNASQADMNNRYHSLLNEGFDIRNIGEFVLGRYRKKAQPEDIDRFMELFQDMIVTTYSRQFSEYKNAKFKALGTRQDKVGNSIVEAQILRDGKDPISVDWKVKNAETNPKIIDVMVEGVSMSVTQRQEYASVMRSHGGIAGLNKILAKKLKK